MKSWIKLSDKDYFKSHALSSTDIKRLLETPAHYTWAEETQSDSLRIGTLAHNVILEPHNPRYNLVTLKTKGKSLGNSKEAEEARAAYVLPCTQSELDECEGMRRAILAIPELKELLEAPDRIVEHAGFFKRNGVDCKIKPDLLIPSRRLVVDLKTTNSANRYAFGHDSFTYGYHMSAAHYLRGVKEITGDDYQFLLIAVEKKAPYHVASFLVPAELLDFANAQIDKAIDTYIDCNTFGYWPSYPQFQTLTYPKYKLENT